MKLFSIAAALAVQGAVGGQGLAALPMRGGQGLAALPSAEQLVERAKNSPCLLFTRQSLPCQGEDALATGSDDADKAAVLERLKRETDATMRRLECDGKVVVPERGGQWPLWLSCRKCGSYIKSLSPTNHVCMKCSAPYAGWPYDDCYLTKIHGELARQTRACGILWWLTADRKYVEHARKILLAYADAYEHYEWHNNNGPVSGPHKGGARVFSQILDEAVWLIPILDGYDAIRSELSQEDRAKIEAKLIRASAETIMTENAKWSNHEVWHLAAYGMAGLVLGDVKMVEKSLNGEYGALNQLNHGILDDGTWYEGSMHYHLYTVNAFLPYFRTLNNLGYKVPERFKMMFLSPIGQLTPDWQRPAINDAWPGIFKPGDIPEDYELAASWWDDDIFQWWVRQKPRKSVEYLLYGRNEVPVRGGQGLTALPVPGAQIASQVFGASGLAILRSRAERGRSANVVPDNCVMMDYGPHGEWHGHPDKLNLMVWLGGKYVSEDPGCIGYGNPMHWGWYKSSLAHNVLRVDNRNQGPSSGELLAFYTNGSVSAVAAFCDGKRPKAGRWDGPAYEGVDIWRITALCGDVVLDYVEARSQQEHDYEWCFHSRGEIDLTGGTAVTNLPPRYGFDKKYAHRDLSGEESWSWTSDTREMKIGKVWSTKWQSKDCTLALWQQASGEGILRTGKGPAQPPSEKLTVVANRVHGKCAAFASVLCRDPNRDVKIRAFSRNGTRGFDVWIDGEHWLMKCAERGRSANVTTAERGRSANVSGDFPVTLTVAKGE